MGRPAGGSATAKLGYTVRVPRSARLDIDNGAGTLRIGGLSGDIDIVSNVGEVMLEPPIAAATAIEATSGIGDVGVSVAAVSQGRLRRVALVGQRCSYQPATPARRVHVKLGVGSITID